MAIARKAGSTWGPRPEASPPTGDAVAIPARDTFAVASGTRYPIDD